MRRIHYVAYLVCPVITVLFSLMIGFVTIINKKAAIPFTMATCQESQCSGSKFWYCGKCKHYTRRPAHHCILCKKCFYYRDHHCFFLGGCVLRQNMGNFILVCLYASFSCIYSVFTLGPYLYNYFVHADTTKLNVYYFALNFFFPITLAKFLLVGDESANVFLVTLFNVSVSIACFSLVYGLWKLFTCLTGRQRYYPDDGKHQDVYQIFGSYGFLNVIFPFNGFLQSRSIDEKYELKSV
ncbi:palmitoyltransferase ZDHHC22 isoform X2 [Nasonia vitripennis]|uniref:Palmitoyltransferase n=1 Tax=Nasonia vitripennis TaxID=7425 RepID=A0A7M7LV87_NASVI|nr:palmitoyltransferase ZDHHC22 isoform X2 [Nasonia vitripennis]